MYTRKSSEEGLEQEFNSLHAQREACAAFVMSQAGLGWKLVADHYDDGGLSGGTMERPALQRLLANITDGKVDVVVVYKIDRLTRSLMDFARIVEVFDSHGVSFVSVTQAFNTTTSMGRLTLNVLLSFAQFEREVTAERIRDKIAASKKKGMWMGGRVPLGYVAEGKKLKVEPVQAQRVRWLFSRYLELRSVSDLAEEDGCRCDAHRAAAEPDAASAWRPLTRGQLYGLLANPLYLGKLRHKGKVHEGEHEAIMDAATFAQVQQALEEGAPKRRAAHNGRELHRLTGIVYDETGDRLSPAHAANHGRRYRYYVSKRLRLGKTKEGDSGWRIAAAELERIVDDELRSILSDEPRLTDWLLQEGTSEHIVPALAAARRLGSDDAEQQSARSASMRTVFRRIVLSPNRMRFEVDRPALISLLLGGQTSSGKRQPDSSTEDDRSAAEAGASIVIERQITLKRRGTEARIIVGAHTSASRQPDRALVDLLGRAHLFLHHLASGQAGSVNELAEQIGVHRADISRVLPLAFLSPAITDAILTGRQPADMTARTLSRLVDVPASWNAQAKLLGC